MKLKELSRVVIEKTSELIKLEGKDRTIAIKDLTKLVKKSWESFINGNNPEVHTKISITERREFTYKCISLISATLSESERLEFEKEIKNSMKGREFIISDLHLSHEALCEGLRGMNSEKYTNLLISNWNYKVKTTDTTYIIGDIVFDKVTKKELDILNQLNGKKVCIGGNHDTIEVCEELNKIGIPVIGCLQHEGYIITHIPVHPEELKLFKGNIHGHIHSEGYIEGFGHYKGYCPGDNYFNVNTEMIDNCPKELSEIIKCLDKKRNNEKEN